MRNPFGAIIKAGVFVILLLLLESCARPVRRSLEVEFLLPKKAIQELAARVDTLESRVDTVAYYGDLQGFLLEALYGEIMMLKELQMPDGSVYQVRPGDTLWSIAESELGDPNRWAEIWLLNIWTIREADLIFPGQLLKVMDNE